MKRKQKLISQEDALEFALKSVTAKRQSVQEMRDRLKRRFPHVDREAIVERLIELEYLNDEAFCAAWIRHRSLGSPRGKYALSQELRRKGIAPALIEEALAEYQESEVIDDLAEKKWDKIKGTSLRQRREKLMRFLLSRGFAIPEVIDTVNRVAEQARE